MFLYVSGTTKPSMCVKVIISPDLYVFILCLEAGDCVGGDV